MKVNQQRKKISGGKRLFVTMTNENKKFEFGSTNVWDFGKRNDFPIQSTAFS